MKTLFIFIIFVFSMMMGLPQLRAQGRPVTDEEFRQFLQEQGGRPTEEFNQYAEHQRQQELLQQQQLQYGQAQQQLQQTQQSVPSSHSQNSNNSFMIRETGRAYFMNNSLNNYRSRMNDIYRRR